MTVKQYAKTYGIKYIINDYNETVRTNIHDDNTGKIVFGNEWCASIVKNRSTKKINKEYSIAPTDYCAYFDWDYFADQDMSEFDGVFYNGCILCDEEEIIKVLELIRKR